VQDLRKTQLMSVRLAPGQLRAIKQAARLESRRRGEVVDESTLVRELALAAIAAMPAAESAGT